MSQAIECWYPQDRSDTIQVQIACGPGGFAGQARLRVSEDKEFTISFTFRLDDAAKKITNRFQCNMHSWTIKGSEWISNSFFCISTAEEGLKIYRDYFMGELPIGPGYPIFNEGFVVKY